MVAGRAGFPGARGRLGGEPIGGGAGAGPWRPTPWVNFAARGGHNASDFVAGGELIGEGSERARRALLRFADGTTAEDEVEQGLVLVYVDHPVACPAQVVIVDDKGTTLSGYSAFERFA